MTPRHPLDAVKHKDAMGELESSPLCHLHAALIDGKLAEAIRLIESGVDVTLKAPRPMPGDQQTALHFAVPFNHGGLIDLLIDKGADVNATTGNGQTALWLACNVGHINSVRALLKRGADPNILNDEGYSPLDRVAASDPAIIELLKNHCTGNHITEEIRPRDP